MKSYTFWCFVEMEKRVSLRWNILPNRLDTNRPHNIASLGSLSLHSCIGNHDDLKTMIRNMSLRKLSHLDISHSMRITGKFSILSGFSFPSLDTLILSNCELNTEDLCSLAEANVKGRLPQLQHLDISQNHNIHRCLISLFPRMFPWQGLSSLNLEEMLDQSEQLDSFVSCIPSLQELVVSGYPQKEISVKWYHLQKLCISEFNEQLLTNIANAVENDMFPNLESVCVKRIVPKSHGNEVNLYNSEAFYKLAKANISCHLEIPSEQPFTPTKCVCKISKKPVKFSIPRSTKYLVCLAGLMLSNLSPEDYCRFLVEK